MKENTTSYTWGDGWPRETERSGGAGSQKTLYLPAAFSRASRSKSCLLLKPISRGFGVA